MRIKDIKSLEDYKRYISGEVPIKRTKKRIKFFNRKVFVPVVAGITTAVILVTMGACNIFKKKKKDKTIDEPTTTFVSLGTTSLDSLGQELPFNTTEKKEIRPAKNSTGVADPNKVVQGSNGKYYINQVAKDKAKNVGTKVNLPEGTKIENEKVVEKQEFYEIITSDGKKEEGKIQQNAPTISNSDQVPNDNYTIVNDEIIKKEDVQLVKDSVVLTYNVYDIDGNVVYETGQTVNKKSLEEGIKNGILFTTKQVKNNQPQQSISTEQSTIKNEETKPTQNSTGVSDSNKVVQGSDGKYYVDQNAKEQAENKKPEETNPAETPKEEKVESNSSYDENGYYCAYGLKFESEDVFNDWVTAGGEGFYQDGSGVIRVYNPVSKSSIESEKVKTLK